MINDIFCTGYFCYDPKISPKKVKNLPVCIAWIGINQKVIDRRYRHVVDEKQFIRLRMMGKVAELVASRFRQGDGVTVKGSLSIHRWKDENGTHERCYVDVKTLFWTGRRLNPSDVAGVLNMPPKNAKAMPTFEQQRRDLEEHEARLDREADQRYKELMELLHAESQQSASDGESDEGHGDQTDSGR